MNFLQIGLVAAALAGGFFVAWRLAWRARQRRVAGSGSAADRTDRATGRSGLAPRLALIERTQAELAARLDELAAHAPEERLQAMAGSLAHLIRDKNATLETALAGLDGLRGRLRALEQMGDLAEARGLFEQLGTRMDELQAGTEARLAGLAARADTGRDAAGLAEQLTRLHAQKDTALEKVFARLAPLETRLGALEGALDGPAAPRAALEALAAELAELRRQAGAAEGREETARAALAARLEAVQARLATLEAPGENPFAEISGQLTRLYAQKDATVETVFARLAPLEARLGEIEAGFAAQDPRAALDGFRERLEAVQGRLGALETPGENLFAEIADQLTQLYAQKDATVATVFARLAPLEERLEARFGALDGFAVRLEALQARMAVVESPGESPFAEISEQLTRLYAQKDATVETVFARLAPLEARLGQIEAGFAARDPQAALDRLAERLEAVQGRVSGLEGAENPFAEISEQLTRLYAQKDATVETVFARLAPLEARLGQIEAGFAARDPQAALDRLAERLEAVQGRVSGLEGAENPFAEISEQLTRLYAQKDATVETVFARLAPLEARLGQIEAGFAARDPQAALDRLAERLEAVQGRVSGLEGAENPFAEISEQLTRLYAQKDATVETVFARLAPLEARLGEIEAGQGALVARVPVDPGPALEALSARVETLHWAQGEVAAGLAALQAAAGDGAAAAAPLAGIADQLTRLYAQKDRSVEAALDRLAPLEARLAALEARPWDPDEDEARAEAQAIAAQLIAARAAAEQTGLFADRLALLEASLPRLSEAQALMAAALERRAAARGAAAVPAADPAVEPAQGTAPVADPAAEPAPEGASEAAADPAAAAAPDGGADDIDAIWRLPRVVSLHHG